MFKYTVFILCFSLFYQILALEKKKVGNEDAKKAIRKVMEVVNNALTQAQNSLDNSLKQVNAKGTELEKMAKVQLDNILKPLKKKLDDIIDRAKAEGFDVTECRSYVDHFYNTPNDLVHNLVDCINQQISEAQNYARVALINARKIEQGLNSIDQEIDQCEGGKLIRMICYAKIIAMIAQDSPASLQDITENVYKGTTSVLGVVPNLLQCFKDQLKTAKKDATQDVIDLAFCVGM